VKTQSRLLARGICSVAAVALVFILSGCMKLDVALTVSADAVDGTMIVAFDRAFIKASGQSEDSFVEGMNKDFTKDAPAGLRAEKYSDDHYVGTKFTFTKVALTEFNKNADNKEDLSIVHDKQTRRYRVSGVFDMSDAKADDEVSKAMLRTFDVKIAITLPGKVVSHNGELSGTTVTWHPKAGERTTLEAVSEEKSLLGLASGSGATAAVVGGVGCALVALLVAGLIGWLVLRKRGRPAATAPETAPPPDE
jgi:hypothetical protein